jgi:HNH endonuclease
MNLVCVVLQVYLSILDVIYTEFNNSSCSLCGWNKIHPVTGKSPLQIDHIDGNWQNNAPHNLRLICPNCHALTETFGSLNKTGNGRRSIGIKYAAMVEMVNTSV